MWWRKQPRRCQQRDLRFAVLADNTLHRAWTLSGTARLRPLRHVVVQLKILLFLQSQSALVLSSPTTPPILFRSNRRKHSPALGDRRECHRRRISSDGGPASGTRYNGSLRISDGNSPGAASGLHILTCRIVSHCPRQCFTGILLSIIFLYQEMAERIGREAGRRGFLPRVAALDEYELARLPEEPLVVFVVATTGDGECPDNMKVCRGLRMVLS